MTKLIDRAVFGASAIALSTLAAPAAAQNVDRIVAFGDSYADTGIARTTIINDPLADPFFKGLLTQLYPTGRFSGGTNYIDTLANILDVPVANFAVGGALTTTFPNGANNTNCSPPGGPLRRPCARWVSPMRLISFLMSERRIHCSRPPDRRLTPAIS